MKLGLLLTTYNRPQYLKECLDYLKRADIPAGTEIIIVDDHSSDITTMNLIINSGYNIIIKNSNKGICDSLVIGFDYLIDKGCTELMNLDADAICRNDFIQRTMELPDVKFIKTGFHCTTKNANGSDRHKILEQNERYNIKASVGGIHMQFNAVNYVYKIRQTIINSGIHHWNWDSKVCIVMGGAVSVNQSVIQHTGIASSMGHHEQPDVASDFKGLSLPDVTLVCVDDDMLRGMKPIVECNKNIEFAAWHHLHNLKLGSKRAYSQFIMHEVHKYVNTSHMLIIQHDGYVKNWKAWDRSWLEYDYIGAPWEWYKDGMNISNGGFSLRSRRLMELCSTLELKTDKDDNGSYAEDHNIGRIYRPYLESNGIRFATIEDARKFAIEGWGLSSQDRKYNGQFGFHGKAVIF